MIREVTFAQMQELWPLIHKHLYVPYTDAEYDQLVKMLNQLIDLVGEDESHPLASLMDVIGVLIENYDREHDLDPDWNVQK